MADFWIKIEKGTPDKPEVLEMSGILGIPDPDTIMGKLIRVWSWFDSNSSNGHAPSVTNVLIDRVTGVTGFTDAMVTVGWLTQNDDGYQVSNFDRHLGKSAKKRANNSERKRMSRERSQSGHAQGVTEARPKAVLEKSRVDKIKDKDKTMSTNKFSDEDFETSNYIFSKILKLNPNAKKPNLESWANQIRLMRETDKRPDHDIREVFDWANQDDFWQSNILSPKKLRDKFDQLIIKMESVKNNPYSGMSAVERVDAKNKVDWSGFDDPRLVEDFDFIEGSKNE